MAIRRAVVLGAIQLAIIVHVVLWLLSRHYGWWGGATLAPLEPSEAHRTVAEGIVNAGFVLFALALAATLLLGRWFCGWACHVVMLQDLCDWLMRRLGVHPKPFRSRLLPWVTLMLALYMFVWPAVSRLAVTLGVLDVTLPPWHLRWQVVTTDFWGTFPGLLVAIPFLGICGFGVVYFLGSKGYCTYGCPYGGFFAPLDRLAPGRIRVTDACEQCGHCTAVCSSNVRVHEEVHQYGQVVDPGCMKCMDCVSVCPNDALYFGFGKPAALRGKPRHGSIRTNFDLTLREEWILLGVYAVVFLSAYGVYGVIPLLMASGIAAIVTWLIWKAWRLIRDRNANLHQFRLKYHGKLSRSGHVVLVLVTGLILLTIHSGAVRVVQTLGVHAAQSGEPRRASAYLRLASSWRRGGMGLLQHPSIDINLARMYLLEGDAVQAESLLTAAIEQGAEDQRVYRLLGRALQMAKDPPEVEAWYDQAIREWPRWTDLAHDAAVWHYEEGRRAQAQGLRRFSWQHNPADPRATRELALFLLDGGELQEGETLLRHALLLEPEHAWANYSLARLLGARGEWIEARRYLDEAIRLNQQEPAFFEAMGYLRQATGDRNAARNAFERARELRRQQANHSDG